MPPGPACVTPKASTFVGGSNGVGRATTFKKKGPRRALVLLLGVDFIPFGVPVFCFVRYDMGLEWAPVAISDAALDGITHGVALRSYEIGITVSAKVETDESATVEVVLLSFRFESVGKLLFDESFDVFKIVDDDFAVLEFKITHGESP
jgi:hypothetical protein